MKMKYSTISLLLYTAGMLLMSFFLGHQAYSQDFSFSPAVNYSIHAAAYPISVAIGDVTGDGKPDIVTANYNSNEVSILTGEGDGTYYAPISYTVPAHPISMVIGDVNHDNKIEIMTANYLNQNVSVLRQVVDSTFEVAGNYSLVHEPSEWPLSIAVGDVNGDGFADIVTGNELSNDISVLLGNNDCSFQTPMAESLSIGEHLYALALGDVNGDGKLDIVTSNDGFSNVAVELGNGDGTFQLPSFYGTFTRARSLALCDLNKDGKLDVIVTDSDIHKISVFLGNGTGTFPSYVNYDVGANPSSITTADINDDGILDVVTANYDSNSVSILLGNGNGTLQAAVNLTVATNPNSVSIADVNNDGKPDIVTANYTGQNVSVLINTTMFPPYFHVSSESLNLGEVPVTGSKTDSVTITNTGIDAPLIIASVTSDNPEFTPSPFADTIPAGTAQKFFINFQPLAGGMRTGHIIFLHNAATSPDSITVTGTSLPGITIADVAIAEGNTGLTNANFTIGLSTACPDPVTLKFITENGTAIAGKDFEADSGDVLFSPGDTAKIITIHLIADTLFEADKMFRVKLFRIANGFIADSAGTCTILNDDSINISLHAKWNIVSVPTTVSNYGTAILFPDAVSPAYNYQSGYIRQDILANGVGYWIKVNNAEIVKMSGAAREHDTIGVIQGWNLIGSTSFPVATHDIGTDQTGLISGQFFEYTEKGYAPADTIQPGKGYWMKANQIGNLLLSGAAPLTSKSRIRIVPSSELPPSPPSGELAVKELPKEFRLDQNYPNPFNPGTIITYALPSPVHVMLKVYNMLGQEVATLVDGLQDAGFKAVKFDMAAASGILPSGIYFYRLNAGSYSDMKKMVVLK
jgi:hypothetical protein